MATIGYTTIGGSSDATSVDWDCNGYTTASGLTYTAVAGDVVTAFNVYGDGTGDAEVAIYTVSGGIPATRVGSGVSVTIGATAGWYSATVSIPLTAGVEYTVATRYAISASWNLRYDVVGGNQQSVAAPGSLPATWTATSTDAGRSSYYATVTTSGPATLVISDGNHAHSATTIDLTGSPTLVSLDAVHAQQATTIDLSVPGGGGTIIGTNTVLGSTDLSGSLWFIEATVGAAHRYTAVAGDVVTAFNVYGDGSGDCSVGVYVWNGTAPTTLVGSAATVTIGATAGWYTTATSIPLTAGVTYVVAIDWFVTGDWNIRYQDPGGTTSVGSTSGPLPATWTQTSTSAGLGSFYATVSGSTPVNLIVENGTHAHAADTIAFPGLPVNLTGLDANHAHSSTTLAFNRFATAIVGRKIVDQAGDVYLMRTFSSWSLADLGTANITTALTSVRNNGFNAVTVWAGGGYSLNSTWDPKYSTKQTLAGAAGNDPWWTGAPWQSSFGSAWLHMDHVVSECLRLGLTLNFSFCGGFGPTGGRPDWEAATNAQMQTVGVSVATRYPKASYPNIVWHLMFDDTHDPGTTAGARVNALFTGINSVEGAGARPVRWMEPNQGASIQSQGWLGTTALNCTMNGWYQYGSNSTEIVETSYAAATTVPTGDVEPPYDGSPHYSVLGQELRERSYATFLEGGVYINYGHEDWWPFGKSGLFSEGGVGTWTAVQNHSHTLEQAHCWTLIDQYVADPTWAPTSTFVTSGQGSGDTKAAAGQSQRAAIAYFPDSRAITVDTTVIAGTGNVRLRWFDPTNGQFTTIVTSEPQNAARVITTYPAIHPDGSRDYVLVVDSTDLIVANGTHAHTATTITLGVPVAGTLEIANAAHAHTANTIALIPALHVLTVQAAAHAHAADTITLTGPVAVTLVVANAAHAQVATTVGLNFGPVTLAVGAALHAHIATTVNLSDVPILPSHSTILGDVTVIRTTTVVDVVVPRQFGD